MLYWGHMESTRRPLLFTLWGIYFACAGFATLVGGIAFWHFGGGLPVLPAAYVAMNFLISRAFLLRQRWLIPIIALNFFGYSALLAAEFLLVGHIDLIRSCISTVLALGALASVYIYRHSVGPQDSWAGVICLVLWILVYTYTASVVLQ